MPSSVKSCHICKSSFQALLPRIRSPKSSGILSKLPALLKPRAWTKDKRTSGDIEDKLRIFPTLRSGNLLKSSTVKSLKSAKNSKDSPSCKILIPLSVNINSFICSLLNSAALRSKRARQAGLSKSKKVSSVVKSNDFIIKVLRAISLLPKPVSQFILK